MATFITAKPIGEMMYNVGCTTTTGYFKIQQGSTITAAIENTTNIVVDSPDFTLIPCDIDGNTSGEILELYLPDCQITSFDGTGLSAVTNLNLINNQLTSFDGAELTSLLNLSLQNNQLTSFSGFGLTNLTTLALSNNQISSFDGAGLSSLTDLLLDNNQISVFDASDLTSLTTLYLNANQINYPIGNQQSQLNLILPASLIVLELSDNTITSLDTRGYELPNLQELNMADCSLSETNLGGLPALTSLNLFRNNLMQFDGSNLGNLQSLNLTNNQLINFNGNGLSSLTSLSLNHNALQSINALGLYNLTNLFLDNNYIATFEGSTALSNLTYLSIANNQLESFDGAGLTSLYYLNLGDNPILTFVTTDLTSLNNLILAGCELTSIDGFTLPTTLTSLNLSSGRVGLNYLTSLDVSNLVNLTELFAESNQLTSVTLPASLSNLNLQSNQLTSLDVSALVNLQGLNLINNPIIPTANDTILSQLVNHSIDYGFFASFNGRTNAGTSDYNTLSNRGWSFVNLDINTPPPTGNGKSRVKGLTQATTTTTTIAPTFSFLNRNESGVIPNTLIEIYSYSDRSRPPMLNLIDSGVTDANGYFYSYVMAFIPRGIKILFKCYDTSDNSGNVTWYGYAKRGDVTIRPLPRSVDYDITIYSNIDNNPIVGLPIIAREYVDSSNAILGIPIDNKGIIGVTDSNGAITGHMVLDYRLEFGNDIFTDDNGVVYKASWQFGTALVGETTFTRNMGIDPAYAQWQLYSIPGNNLISLDQVDGLGNLISNVITFPDTNINDTQYFSTLIGGLNYRVNVYDGTDNPPLTEPIYTETWTAAWNEVHTTDLSATTTTTTTEAPTTTTTTTIDSTLLVSVNGSGYTQNDSVWYDQSSYGNNGVLYNGVGYSSSDGGYLTFDGSNDYVDFGNPSNLQLSDGTVSLWVKATSSNSGFKAIAAKRNSWGIFLVNNILSVFDWGNYYATGFNINNGLRSTGVNIGDNQWHNVVLTFTGIYDNLVDNVIVYLDGTPILTTTILNYEQIYNVRIGDGGYPGQNLSGGIGQAEIYNRVFTSSEVSDNYNTEKSKYGL